MKRSAAALAAPALWLAGVLLAAGLAPLLVDAATRSSHGFGSYYTAGRLAAAGADVGRFYDNEWFAGQVERQVPGIRDVFQPNPPSLALLLLPLAGLDHAAGRLLWTVLSLLCLLPAVGLPARLMPLRGPWLPALVVLTLLYQPLHANLRQGQAYLLLLALLALAWYAYREGWEALLGGTLGLLLSLKLAGLLLLPLLVLQRRVRALAWTALTALVLAGLTLALFGAQAWLRFGEMLAGSSSLPERSVSAYQSQLSLLRHLLAYDQRWNPAPLLHAPGLAHWLPWLGFALILGLSVLRARGEARSDAAFAAFTIAGVVLSPFSLDYHYTLLLLPIAILAASLREQRGPGLLVMVVAVGLIALDLPYRSAGLQQGAWALLAYPKLYGALLLWGLALSACRERRAGFDRRCRSDELPALRSAT